MNRISRQATIFLSALLIAVSVYGLFNRQQILDYLALRSYTPTSEVAALASETTMQDRTRRLFYINHPQLNDKPDFRQNCPATEQSIVLGCYVASEGIFLLKVEDKRLQGVSQVTAAHEVLHAHYDRLSSKEKQRVDQLTADAFAELDDDRVKKTVEQYRKKDPSVVPNELHSILATEVRSLSVELETYYRQYFADREKIVQFSENYEQTFVSLSQQVEDYDKQLTELKEQINSNQLEIAGLQVELESQKSRLEDLRGSGDTEAYNAAVPVYNTQVNSYNSLISTTKELIEMYNDIVEKRNNIATTEQQLVEAINSNVTPIESQ